MRRIVIAAIAAVLSVVVILLDARPPAPIPVVDARDLVAFHHEYDKLFRNFFGCPADATKPADCASIAARPYGREWKKAA